MTSLDVDKPLEFNQVVLTTEAHGICMCLQSNARVTWGCLVASS